MKWFARLALFVSISIVAGACAPSAPLDRSQALPHTEPAEGVEVGEVPVHGFHVVLDYASRRVHTKIRRLAGELVAADDQEIWVLLGGEDDEDGGRSCLVVVESYRVVSVWVEDIYDSKSGTLLTWTALGSAASLTHGFIAIYSLPIWLITGLSETISAEGRSQVQVEDQRDFPKLFQYARFPQGLPAAWRERPRCELR